MARQTREGRRISDALLDELLVGQNPSEVFRDGSLIDDLKKAVAERALDAEMEAHLGREREQITGNFLTLWRETPKWRAAARSLIPSRHARRTLRYSSTV